MNTQVLIIDEGTQAQNNNTELKEIIGEKHREDKRLKYCEEIKGIVARGVITEGEIKLIALRLNRKALNLEDAEPLSGLSLTPEQTEKGITWLKNYAFKKNGDARINSPFGYCEEEAIKNFKEFKLNSFIDAINYSGASHWYTFAYDVIGESGVFTYYLSVGEAVLI